MHDAEGRLKAVVDPEGQTAVYNWDAAGNLRSITRHASTTLSIIQLSPDQADIGETVTVEGTGFSTTPASNTVKFNGTTASVSTATSTSLTVKVPAKAESGPITVSTLGEGPVTSSQSFTVAETSAPHITSLSPSVATAGEEVTISGSGFDENALDDIVTYNGVRPLLASASSSAVTLKVPAATLGGQVVLTSPRGTSAGPDLFVPPNGISSSKVGDTDRFSIGGSATTEISSEGKKGLDLFDGVAGEKIAFLISESSFAGKVSIWSPRDVKLPGSAVSFTKSGGGLVEPVTLPEKGTYTILLEGEGAQTGSLKLAAYEVKDQTGSITPTKKGVEQSVSITAPGQNARFSVPVSASEVVGVKASSSTFKKSTYDLEWRLPAPSGEQLSDHFISASGGFLRQQFAASGTYTLVVNPEASDTGAVTLTVYDASDHTGSTLTPTEEGASETFSVEVPGQHNLITFSGSKEERVSLVASKGNFDGKVAIKSPKGSTLGSTNIHPEPETRWVEPITLPENGTYTILLEGQEAQTGKTKLTAYKVKDQTGSITPTEKGVEQSVSITAAGQTARFSVPVSTGGVVSVKAPSSSFSSFYYLEWYKPGGEYLGGGTILTSGGFLRQQFSSSGTYTLVLKPVGFDTGAVTLTVYDASDHTGSTLAPTEEGASETFSVEVPGQHNLITFSGSKEERISLVASKGNFDGKIALKSPKGSSLGSANIHSNGETRSIEEVTLPESGTYTIVLEGLEAQTGTVKLSAYLLIAWHPPSGFETELVSLDTPLSSVIPPSPQMHPSRIAHSSRSGPTTIPSPKPKFLNSDTSSLWLPPKTSRGSRGWETNGARSPWAEVAPLHAQPGETALAGKVLEQNGRPLKGIKVSLEGAKEIAKTDAAGRFLLAGVSAGHQILVVDGNSPKRGQHFGTYEMGVKLDEGSTTTLEYTVWLTALDPAGDQRIESPTKREEILKSPRIPGLEVRLPKGTVIRNPAGRRVRNLNITAIPVDRPPAPLPAFQTIPLYYTIQPGRAYLSKGARIIYPNWTHLPPGQRVAFWNYDADNRGWYIYGHGSVTANGKQIVPDPGVRVWEFTGAMISGTPTPPSRGPIPGSGDPAKGGDPVDLHSGLFTYHRNDLVLPDTIPIVIERTYRQADSNSYSFGIGAKNPYDIQLWSTNNYHEADLILPDGGRVHFVRTSPGEGFIEAIYRSTSSPGEFYGSTLSWDGATPGWDLKLKSGLTYLFGDVAPLQGIRDQFGNELKITREGGPTGRISNITSPHGRWVDFTYDGANHITEISDNGGQHLKYKYESSRLVSATDAAGRTTKYGYDGSGNMASVTDGRGVKYLEVKYDGNNRVSKQTDADGGSFEFSYELNGKGEVKTTTLTEPPEGKRKVEFNADGFPTSESVGVESKDEETTAFERQAGTGLMLSMTDPLGRKTAFKYDSDGNIVEVIRLAETGEAQSSKFSYEPGTEELLTATDPAGHVTKYEYGPKGQLLSQIDALKHETSFEYNEDGQIAAITDPEGDTTELSYDNGDLIAVTDPLGRETTQFVDTLGRVRAVATPSGARTRYSYNEDGQVTSVIGPLGATTAIEYDEDGDPIKLTDPLKNETSATYDVMDRLESETDALKHTAEWTYDTGGNLLEAVDRRGKVSKFAYDPLGRMEEAQFGVSGESAESTIDYEYDEVNRVKAVKDSASGEYGLAYDKLDQLTELAGPEGAVGYRYDEVGRREAMEVPGQKPVEYGYDNANRLTKVSRGSEAVGLEYDEANRLERVLLSDGIEESYGYDEAGELTSISFEKEAASLGDLNYAYDTDGHTEAIWGSLARTGIPEALGSTEYNADNELVEGEGKELTYDKDGNLTYDGSSEYEWDARGQLVKISKGASAAFAYDPFGRRISKTLGGTTTDLLSDGSNVVQESVKGKVSANLLTGLRPDSVYSRNAEGGSDSYLTDALGSTVALANGGGEVKTSYSYDPFGTATATGAESSNPFQFTGRENDGNGLQYNRARYYSALESRFISQDPSGFAGSGPDLYQYAGDDPIDFTDPSGLELHGDGNGPHLPRPEELKGGCLAFSVGAGIGVSAQVCVVHIGGHAAILGSGGIAGYVGWGASLIGGPLYTKASQAMDLAGNSTYTGAVWGEGLVGGTSYSASDNGATSLFVGVGAGAGTPIAGERGRSQTGVSVLW